MLFKVLAVCLLSEGQRLYLHWSHKVFHSERKQHFYTSACVCSLIFQCVINFVFLSDRNHGDTDIFHHGYRHPV